MLPQKLNLVHGKYGYVSKRGVFFVAAMNSHSGKVKTLLKSLVTLVYWFVCHTMYKVKGKKLFKMSWRGSPREATGRIRNGLPQ